MTISCKPKKPGIFLICSGVMILSFIATAYFYGAGYLPAPSNDTSQWNRLKANVYGGFARLSEDAGMFVFSELLRERAFDLIDGKVGVRFDSSNISNTTKARILDNHSRDRHACGESHGHMKIKDDFIVVYVDPKNIQATNNYYETSYELKYKDLTP